MSDIVNPFIVGKAVTGSEMFFGREDVFQFIRHTLRGQHQDNVIVLYGQRRTGKTSVLHQMHSHLDPHYLCIFMDMHGFALEGLGGFLWEMANYILRGLRRDYQMMLPCPKRGEFMIDPLSFFENEFLNQVRSAIGDRYILLMLDEVIYLQEQVQAGKLEPKVFEYMRHLMQHYKWLNFLFSLGSGLEELEMEYAFLFSVGLYKKISFLDRNAANKLITQPVKDYYQVSSAALERLYHITSGHPYYTQLLCHCLFNSWQQEYISHIEAPDVDKVLDKATELGSAVLTYAWEELASGEKAIVAGMTAAMGKSNHAVSIRNINWVWRQHCNVIIPKGDLAQAIRSLIARDAIIGQDTYAFKVDLQRLWVQKHKRIEWVKEEIAGFPFKPLKPPIHITGSKILLTVMMLLLIGGSGRLFYSSYYLPNQQRANATATAQTIITDKVKAAITTLQNPYPPYQGTLALNDPLLDNSHGYNWDQRSGDNCQFPGDGYHVATAVQSYTLWCAALATSFSNFAYQAQMTILKGDSGGLIFRADIDNSKVYDFEIDQHGYFNLSIYTDNDTSAKLEEGLIPSFHKGIGQSNLIAVIAQDDYLTLYVNLQYVTRVTDANFGQGQIGVEATETDNPTEVVFTNAKVWKLS